jgi:hypothetical protein
MAFTMNLSDIAGGSQQHEAVTGRKRKNPYASVLTGLGPALRTAARTAELDDLRGKELEQTQRNFDASQALTREQMKIAEEQNAKATLIGGLSTGVSAAAMADKAGMINLKDLSFSGLKKYLPGGYGGGGSAAPELVAGADGVLTSAGTGEALLEGGGQIAPELIGEAGAGGTAGVGGAAGSALGTVGSAVSTAVPYIALARIGMPLLGSALEKWTPGEPGGSNVFQQGARITKDEYMRPIEAVHEAFGIEVPEVAEAIFNPGGYIMKSLCIIVTACTSPDSHEVNVARQFRDRYMDNLQLRGYYRIAEKTAPVMHRYPAVKRFVKRYFVDGFVQYGECALGLTTVRPGRWAAFVTAAFLGLCGCAGARRQRFVRSNGEVF